MNVHAGGETSVMDLYAFDLVDDEDLAPSIMHFHTVRQEP